MNNHILINKENNVGAWKAVGLEQLDMSFQKITFLGLPITIGMDAKDVCDLIGRADKGQFITFVNPYAWHVARENKEYLAALSQMTCVLPDGMGVAVACRKMTGFPCHRVSFDMTSAAGSFFTTLAVHDKTVMLIGGAAGVAEKVGEKLLKEYPGLRILKSLSGFDGLEVQVNQVMSVKPDVVIVGMGVPLQELLLARLKHNQYEGLAITCGGFFDQYLQATYYYPPLINRLNLRFAYRLYKEPGRLWRRYLIEYKEFISVFLGTLIKRDATSGTGEKILLSSSSEIAQSSGKK